MTLNGHFTLNFHDYEQPFLHIYCRVCLQREMCGCAEADRDPPNIWDPRKNCGSFVDATKSKQIRPTLVYYLLPERLSTDSKTRDLE